MTWRDRFKTKGRDSRYTVATVEILMEELRDGRSMRDICSSPEMPDRETVRDWMDADDDLAAAITRAREIGFIDRGERAVADAKAAVDPQRGRLAFDAERWFLGKMSKAFADKTIIAGDKDNPLAIDHRIEGAAVLEALKRKHNEAG